MKRDTPTPVWRSQAAWTHGQIPQDPRALPEQRYRVDGEIGRGGMGVVWAATDLWLGRQIALKRPLPGTAQAVIDRMNREARITARLTHPSIAPVLDVGEDASGPFYTMPMLVGRKPWDPDAWTVQRWVEIVRDVARAVGHAHAHGLVHRDLKPDNILVGDTGEVWVLDWGVAWDAANPDTARVGTPEWSAPEQAEGRCTAASDVYVLGRLLGGVKGDAALRAIARKATEGDPGARYPNGRTLAEELDRWLLGMRVRAHEYRLFELVGTVVRSNPVAFGVGAVAVVAGLVFGTVALRAWAVERARTDAAVVQAWLQRAASASRNGAHAEAERLASEALLRGESASARGILAFWAGQPRPVLLATGTVRCAGEWLPNGTEQCVEAGRVVVGGATGPLVEHVLPERPGTGWRAVRTFGDQVLASEPPQSWIDGSQRHMLPIEGPSRLSSGPAAAYVVGGEVVFVDADGTVARRVGGVCNPAEGLYAVEDRALVVCGDGVVAVDGDDVTTLPVDGSPSDGVWDSRIVVGTYEGDVHLWGDDGWRVLSTDAGPVSSLSRIGPHRVAVTTEEQVTRILDTTRARWSSRFPDGFSEAVASPAGVRLIRGETWFDYAVGGASGSGSLDLRDEGGIADIAWGQTQGHILVGTAQGRVHVWEPAMDAWTTLDERSDNVAKGVAWARGRVLHANSAAQRSVWGLNTYISEVVATENTVVLRGYGSHIFTLTSEGLTLQPRSNHVLDLVADGDGWWELERTGALVRYEHGVRVDSVEVPGALAVEVAGPRLVTVHEGMTVLRRRDGEPMWTVANATPVTAVAMDGSYVALGTLDGIVTVLDVETGAVRATVGVHRRRVSDLLLSGDQLFTASWDGWVHRMDLSVLDTPAEALHERIASDWGLPMEALLR